MARKRKSSAEGFLDLVALLPWWAGALLAVASYIALDRLSGLTPAPPAPGQMGTFLQVTMLAAFANIGKIIVPALCAIAAAISFARRRKRTKLVAHARTSGADAIASMTWREFEAFVCEVFRERGYSVAENFDGGADGGVDLVLRQGRETVLVQCKHWRVQRVGVGVVREIFGVMAARSAHGAYVVTSGSFTDDAQEFARGKNLTLWDGDKLQELLRLRPSLVSAADQVSQTRAKSHAPLVLCPKCGSKMVRRQAKAGAHAGKMFWGCGTFPTCRGTRDL